jgi:hypothetical protein
MPTINNGESSSRRYRTKEETQGTKKEEKGGGTNFAMAQKKNLKRHCPATSTLDIQSNHQPSSYPPSLKS